MESINLLIEYHQISDLKPYEKNARKHAKKDIKTIVESIKEFGFNDPIGIWSEDNLIVEGHGRLMAAKEIGMDSVPCIRLDHLTEEQRRAYALAHNKTAEMSEWDMDLLPGELLGIDEIDMELFGFVEEKQEEKPEKEKTEGKLLEEASVQKTKKGDIWKLGDHFIMCGDSTEIKDVEKLLQGGGVDMVFTDPPFALFGNSTGVAGVSDDKMIKPFFSQIFANIKKYLKINGHAYICCDWHSYGAIYNTNNMEQKNLIVWQKTDGGGIGSYYTNNYELIVLVANQEERTVAGKSSVKCRTINGVGNIWKVPIVQSKKRIHNAQKPVEVVKIAIENSSDPREKVLDLFGGSGTTLMACEETNRICYMMEYEEKYVDGIINRFQNETGQKAELISQ